MKRILDLAAVAILAGPAALAMLFCAIAIRADSPGPVLFRQRRIGRNGEEFVCFKLRTMHVGTGDRPSHEVGFDAVTRVGHFLRRLKLDELPQLWNIVRGEMSLVGPRPCLPSQRELIEARRALGVLSLRPGITGVSQIRGIDMSDPQKLANADAGYAPGVANDIRILAATILGAGRGDRVRRRG